MGEEKILYKWFYEYKFSDDIILKACELTINTLKPSISYMDKIARAWAEVDIHTLEAAKEYSKLNSDANITVKKAFGIQNRNLVPLETDMIRTWLQEYGFTIDMIKEACNRTIKNTQQPRFDYANTILLNWKKEGIRTIKDVQTCDHAFHKSQAATPKNVKKQEKHRKIVVIFFTRLQKPRILMARDTQPYRLGSFSLY